MLSKMKKIPVSIAVIIMIVCVLAGIVLGNHKAMRMAVEDAAADYQILEQRAKECAVQAGNLLVVAKRVDAEHPALAKLDDAIRAQKAATSAPAIAQTNKALKEAVTAVSQGIKPTASAQDAKLITAAVDNFLSEATLLSRAGAAYNISVEKALDAKKSLPTGFLLGGSMPEVYQ